MSRVIKNPHDRITKQILSKSEIVYCGGGGRSALAVNTLLQMGYTKLSSMAGGYRAWTEAGLPIVDEH